MTSLVASSRSASTNSRSASAVAGESAPLTRTTPLLCSSFPSTERGGSRLAAGFALALALALAFLTPPFGFAAPKPAPLSARPPFCTRTSSAVPSCNSERSFSARAAIALSWSSWSCDLWTAAWFIVSGGTRSARARVARTQPVGCPLVKGCPRIARAAVSSWSLLPLSSCATLFLGCKLADFSGIGYMRECYFGGDHADTLFL